MDLSDEITEGGARLDPRMSGLREAPTNAEMSALIATELNQLGNVERNKIFEDVHGIPSSGAIEETEDLLIMLADALIQETRRIRERSAFDKALFLSPRYVSDVSFLAMFLRCDNYNIKSAAARLVCHFQRKLELFGDQSLLGRDILYDDLSDGVKSALRSGTYQLSPRRRDRAGRPVGFASDIPHPSDPEDQVRAIWYLVMVHLRGDIAGQKQGIVTVRFGFYDGGYAPSAAQFKRKAGTILPTALPFKIAAYHYCYSNPSVVPMMSLTQLVMGMASRIRFRAHYGSLVECQYALMTFGISKSAIPVDNDGELQIGDFLKTLELHIQQERVQYQRMMASMNDFYILFPRTEDVLLGRGRPYQNYVGNRKLADSIDQRRSEYRSSGKAKKTEMTLSLVHEIKQLGGRFLKKSDDGKFWMVVEDEIAREKVSHGFRAKSKGKTSLRGSSPIDTMHANNSSLSGFPEPPTSSRYDNLSDVGELGPTDMSIG